MNTFQGIRKGLAAKIGLLPVTAGGLCLLLGLADCQAQPAAVSETREAQGRVERMTTARRGEIDGGVLEDGTWLHWPPHLADQFARTIKAGDQVRAAGRVEIGKKGDTRFEIRSVTNLRSNTTVENQDFGSGPPAGRRGRGKRGIPPAPDAPISTERGIAQRFTTAPKGETDGVVLDSGTWLHWPPHLDDRFANMIKPGDRLQATGRVETGKRGEVRFEVQSVTNLRTNTTVENPELADGRSPRSVTAPNDAGDREQRLRDLQDQVERLQREIERLKSEK